MAHARTRASESTPSANLYQPPSSMSSPLSAHTNDEPTTPAAGSETNAQATELAGAIANLIRAVRRGGEESSGTGVAPPAYREAP
jgi:hypothetical protein